MHLLGTIFRGGFIYNNRMVYVGLKINHSGRAHTEQFVFVYFHVYFLEVYCLVCEKKEGNIRLENLSNSK